MTDTSSTKTPPFDKVFSVNGDIEIPIWRKEHDDGRATFSMTEHQRTYFDKTKKKYVTTTTIFDNDSAEVAAMYSDARNRMQKHRAAAYKAWKENQQSSNSDVPANEQAPVEEQAA